MIDYFLKKKARVTCFYVSYLEYPDYGIRGNYYVIMKDKIKY